MPFSWARGDKVRGGPLCQFLSVGDLIWLKVAFAPLRKVKTVPQIENS